MANCPHCNRTEFEIETTKFKRCYVQCSGCKSPVGVVECNDVALIDEFKNRITDGLRVIVSSLQVMNSRLDRIEEAIQARQ
jgi:hypothetical protein